MWALALKFGNTLPNGADYDRAIKDVAQSDGQLVVAWNDGWESAYHFIWLSDNCGCDACGNKVPTSGERFLRLTDLPADIAPANAAIGADGALCITWADGGHASRYDPARLRAREEPGTSPVLWDSGLSGAVPEVSYGDVKAGVLPMLEHLRSQGLSVVRGVLADNDKIERLAGLLGFIRQTHYGRVFEIRSQEKNVTLAETKHAIPPHNDELFRDAPPGVIVFHCLEASADGGGASLLVDGLNVAALLRDENPAAFDVLSRVPLPHRRRIDGAADFRAETPMIVLDAAGAVTAFRCNERTMESLESPEDQVKPVYGALQAVLALVCDPAMKIEFQHRSGEAQVFDNHRVLHARTAFGGSRHIRQCHVDRDEVFSRLRLLQAS